MIAQPSMCGAHARFISRSGDWTWETVSMVCGLDVFSARGGAGEPVHFPFYYYRVRAQPAFGLGNVEIGDPLEVTSRVFEVGLAGEALLTLHRIRRTPRAQDENETATPLSPEEFYDRPSSDSIYVENLSRWVSRGRPGSNIGLRRAAPMGLSWEHLPDLPDHSFLRRDLLDSRICYLANADVGAALRIQSATYVEPKKPADEVTNMTIEDEVDDRALAICSYRTALLGRVSDSVSESRCPLGQRAGAVQTVQRGSEQGGGGDEPGGSGTAGHPPRGRGRLSLCLGQENLCWLE